MDKAFKNYIIFKLDLYLINDDDIYNNPNIHSEEQDELELPENVQSNYKIEMMQKQEEKHYPNIEDNDEIYNNPNIHSEEQDELELPENVQSNYKIKTMQNQEEKHYTNVEADDDIYNNPNIHSEEQNELKLPENDDDIYNNPNIHSEEQNVQHNYKIETMQKQIKVDDYKIFIKKLDESKLPKCKNGKKHVLRQLWCFKTCFACFERCFKPFSK
ncbi:hypothetical protein RhiirC2_713309 [Rhizophagus irregularis]|uniref:Uncharacterized protein n=1 Tax=Rhizophagus irregularis TaxID=588596 RepID=A0A2N1N3T0_9GLOM|nr:hypothetical protein RhiirC2_713309 [Rhizophagus irregularis]